MKAQVVIIEGYWKDTRESFEKRCVVMPKGATDSMRDEVLDEARCGLGFNGIFYVFEEGDNRWRASRLRRGVLPPS